MKVKQFFSTIRRKRDIGVETGIRENKRKIRETNIVLYTGIREK